MKMHCALGASTLCGVVVAMVVILTPAPAAALVIDNFNDGFLVWTHSDGPPFFTTADGAGIVGGERAVSMSPMSQAGPNGADTILVVDFFNGNTLAFAANNILFGSPSSYSVFLRYDGDNGGLGDFGGLGAVDVSDGGTSDAVRIRVLHATVPFFANVSFASPSTGPFEFNFYESFFHFGSVPPNVPVTSVPVDIVIPFTQLFGSVFSDPFDPTTISWISVIFETVLNDPPLLLQIDFIDTFDSTPPDRDPSGVPLPGTALLVSVGLAAFTWRRGIRSGRPV